MKQLKITWISLIIFLVGFIFINLVTANFASPSDGNDLVGFPFRFYQYLGGKRLVEPYSRNIFNYLNLSIDISVCIIASIFIENLIRISKIYSK